MVPQCQIHPPPKQACFVSPFYFCKSFALCQFSHDKPFPSLLVSNPVHPSLPRVPGLHFTHSFNKGSLSLCCMPVRAENTTGKTPAHMELTFLHLLFPKLPLPLVYNAIIVWDCVTCLRNQNPLRVNGMPFILITGQQVFLPNYPWQPGMFDSPTTDSATVR